MSEHEHATAGGDRPPSDAERPPVSRVGDELQKRADDDGAVDDAERVEREAFDEATEKGWDKPLNQ